jgi:hypothetical protein
VPSGISYGSKVLLALLFLKEQKGMRRRRRDLTADIHPYTYDKSNFNFSLSFDREFTEKAVVSVFL